MGRTVLPKILSKTGQDVLGIVSHLLLKCEDEAPGNMPHVHNQPPSTGKHLENTTPLIFPCHQHTGHRIKDSELSSITKQC